MSRALGGNKAEEKLEVQELQSLAFDAVESALWGDKDKPVSRILFKIRCFAHVIGAPVAAFFPWSKTTFSVGGGKQTSFATSVPQPKIEKELPVTLYGEARLQRNGETWQLTELRVDKSLPVEEWMELQNVALQLGK